MPFIGKQSSGHSKIKKSRFTATASQTDFSVVSAAGDELQVFLNGVLLKETDDYTYTTSTVTLGTGASVNDIVEVHVYQSFAIADTVDITGDTMTGELEVPTVKLSSNVIKASDGGSTITLDTSDNVTISGAISANNLVGMIAPFAMATPPTGWLVCNGSEYAIATYGDLYTAIGTTWGSLTNGSGGAGSTHFKVPDLRGEFLRGLDNGAGNDPDASSRTGGDAVGSSQSYEIQSHTHQIGGSTSSSGSFGRNVGTAYQASGATGGNETRPRNKNVQYCIKY